jgi:hypothetical protein
MPVSPGWLGLLEPTGPSGSGEPPGRAARGRPPERPPLLPRLKAAVSAASRSAPRSALARSAAAGRARTTTAVPAGSAASRSRTRWRSRRRTLFRITAVPTDLATTKPARAGEVCTGAADPSTRCAKLRCTTTEPRPLRRPLRMVAAKSSRRLSRCAAASIMHPWVSNLVAQAARRVRPLPRRAERIARPARVRMRSRKPWVFARRRLFGWYVRLLTSGLRLRCLRATSARKGPLRGLFRLASRGSVGHPAAAYPTRSDRASRSRVRARSGTGKACVTSPAISAHSTMPSATARHVVYRTTEIIAQPNAPPCGRRVEGLWTTLLTCAVAGKHQPAATYHRFRRSEQNG